MRSLFVVFAAVAAILPILISPVIGVMVWSWISYMNPHRLSYGWATTLPFLDFVAALTLLALVITPERYRLPRHPLFYLIIAYLAFTAVTYLGATLGTDFYVGDTRYTPEQKLIQFSKIILFTLLTSVVFNTRERLHYFLWIIFISLAFFALKGGVFTVISGGFNRVFGPPNSFFADNNHFGVVMAIFMPITAYLTLHFPTLWLRWIAGITTAFAFAAAVGTHSRGTLIGLAVMAVFVALRSKKRFLVIPVMIALGAVTLAVVPSNWIERMETIESYEKEKSALSRIYLWQMAKNIADNNVLGGGFNVFYKDHMSRRYSENYEMTVGRAVHSTFFEVLGEHGYGGLFLFLMIMATAFVTQQRIATRTRGDPDLKWAHNLSRLLQVGIVGFAGTSLTVNLAQFDLYWHVIAITICLDSIVTQQQATERESAMSPRAARFHPDNGARPGLAYGVYGSYVGDNKKSH